MRHSFESSATKKSAWRRGKKRELHNPTMCYTHAVGAQRTADGTYADLENLKLFERSYFGEKSMYGSETNTMLLDTSRSTHV